MEISEKNGTKESQKKGVGRREGRRGGCVGEAIGM